MSDVDTVDVSAFVEIPCIIDNPSMVEMRHYDGNS